MDVKVSNQTNNSPQESGVNTLTSSQICGGYFNKGDRMNRPRSIVAAEANMNVDVLKKLKTKMFRVMKNYVWDDEVSDEAANKKVDAVNAEWIAAGGPAGSKIARK